LRPPRIEIGSASVAPWLKGARHNECLPAYRRRKPSARPPKNSGGYKGDQHGEEIVFAGGLQASGHARLAGYNKTIRAPLERPHPWAAKGRHDPCVLPRASGRWWRPWWLWFLAPPAAPAGSVQPLVRKGLKPEFGGADDVKYFLALAPCTQGRCFIPHCRLGAVERCSTSLSRQGAWSRLVNGDFRELPTQPQQGDPPSFHDN